MSTGPIVAELSILVVDDETLIARLLEDMLVDIGCIVVGPAPSVAQAAALIESEGQTLDGALLDINLRGELVYPVADALAECGVPFVFISGYASHGIDVRYELFRLWPSPSPDARSSGQALRRTAPAKRTD